MDVSSGSIVTVVASAQVRSDQTPQQVIQNVSFDLTGAGLPLKSYTIATEGAAAQLFGLLTFNNPSFVVTMEVQAQQDDDTDDIISTIRTSFYTNTGFYPDAVSATAINGTATGEPAPSTQPLSSNTPGSSIADSISSFFSSLQTGGITLLIVIVGIIILVLVLIAYAPNVGGIAHAAGAAAIL